MENRNPILALPVIEIGGVNANISCTKCPSACCRQGTAIPLARTEAQSLVDAGTDLRRMTRQETRGKPAGRGKRHYELLSDCGNLLVDPDTGDTSCAVYETDRYPAACRKFAMGGYACGLVQLSRIRSGEDEASQDELLKT